MGKFERVIFDLCQMSKVTTIGTKTTIELPLNQELLVEQVEKGGSVYRLSFNSRFIGHVNKEEVREVVNQITEAAKVLETEVNKIINPAK